MKYKAVVLFAGGDSPLLHLYVGNEKERKYEVGYFIDEESNKLALLETDDVSVMPELDKDWKNLVYDIEEYETIELPKEESEKLYKMITKMHQTEGKLCRIRGELKKTKKDMNDFFLDNLLLTLVREKSKKY